MAGNNSIANLRILANIAENGYKAISNQTLTVSGVNTLTVPAKARYALIYVKDGDIRYWEDGSNPTNNAGIFRSDGTTFDVVEYTNLQRLRIIDVAGTPVIQVQYYE